MDEERERKFTVQEIKKYLLETGFPFEMYVARCFEKMGYKVDISNFFLDLEEEKKREIDLIATKNIGNLSIVFIIECKQSNKDAWIFVAPESKYSRKLSYVKYLPLIQDFDVFKKCFVDLHIFDKKVPLATNCISYNGNKKGNQPNITDAVKKVVKATINQIANYQHNYSSQDRAVFFSAVFFSGNIFLTEYKNSLKVKKEKYLLLKETFHSSSYKKTKGSNATSIFTLDESWEERREKEQIDTMKSVYSEFGPEFIVDIVQKDHVEKYLKEVEDKLGDIELNNWPIKGKSSDNLPN